MMRGQLGDSSGEKWIDKGANRFPLLGESSASNIYEVNLVVLGLIVLHLMTGIAFADEPKTRVFFERQDSVKVYFDLEVANTFAKRSEGLMWRRIIPARSGMLFDFEKNSRIRMWMKNTQISLDMIFLDERRNIVHIHEAAQPLSLDIIESPYDAQFTVEINAGEARRYELSVGDRLHIR